MSSDAGYLNADITDLGIFAETGEWTVRNNTLVAVIPTTNENRRKSGKKEVVFDLGELRNYVELGQTSSKAWNKDFMKTAVKEKDLRLAALTLRRCPKLIDGQ